MHVRILAFFLLFGFAFVYAQTPRTYTSSELILQLKKAQTVGSVLYVAAHPDDENTRLIACLVNEHGLRTGYLSLTRGDGGQNLIGPEQGIELGVIRTQELLAARRIDGGEQYFTRAYDFGYSKTPQETLQKWNRDSILGDMVWVIRNFRPDIIISRFAADGSGGHGHHTASAILAEEAFDAAADSTRFTEQLKYVKVWQARRLFWNVSSRFSNPNADMSPYLKLDVGGYNPLLGKSYGEIAAESRSMHKSQGFGSARQRGENFEYFKPIKGDTIGLKNIFDGIDFTWKRIPDAKETGARLENIRRQFNAEAPQASVEALSEVWRDLENVNNSLTRYHRDLLEALIAQCSGYYLEGIAATPQIAQDDSLRVFVYSLYRNHPDAISAGTLRRDTAVIFTETLTEHYWLDKPLKDNRYEVANLQLLTRSQENTYTNALVGFHYFKPVNNTHLLKYGIQYKWTDPEKGELYRTLVITPPVMINLAEKALVFADSKMREVTVVLKAGKDSVSGLLKIDVPKGWFIQGKGANLKGKLANPEEYGRTFSIDKKGNEETVVLQITPPAHSSYAMLKIRAEIGEHQYSKGIKEVKYDHIPVQTLFPEAEAKLIRLDLIRKSKRIGYIPGAGDEVQACLAQLGYEVITLTNDMLKHDDLSKYQAIITGVRAYNTNDKMPEFKKKLMDFVNRGGNLIVQYNTNSFAGPFRSDIGPYKFKITRERVTDEQAEVRFDLPEHAVLNYPNKLVPADFESWIQERSIYHAGDWDEHYVAPLSMNDPGEKSTKGALIISPYGKGNFMYTGIVFFRQLPAGVPGAYRLLVNLIEMKR